MTASPREIFSRERAARVAYAAERDRWLVANHPELAGRDPVHKCSIGLLDDDDDGHAIEFEELGPGGLPCGARRRLTHTHVFGGRREVIATVSGLPADHPWVIAVCDAIAREHRWENGWRRSGLCVVEREGEMFHVTRSANRDSIRTHGLDWRLMAAASGIAGSRKPELPGIFLCDWAASFVHMAREPVDVWAVSVDGLWLETDPGADFGVGWAIVPHPIGVERLRLAETDLFEPR